MSGAGSFRHRQYVDAAIFADVGVMIIAVLNAIRALFVKNYNVEIGRTGQPCISGDCPVFSMQMAGNFVCCIARKGLYVI